MPVRSPVPSSCPQPEPTDDLETTARKLRDLAKVVEEGASLAVRTGNKRAAHTERDPVMIAKQRMTPTEAEQYDAWASGAVMPTINWQVRVKEVVGSAAAITRTSRRAEAMRTIWKDNSITPENAAWLSSELTAALPLVNAVAKISAAQRDLDSGQVNLCEMEMAELQTAQKVVATAVVNMNQVFARLNLISRDLNQSREVIQAREHAIKEKISAYKQKKDPINE